MKNLLIDNYTTVCTSPVEGQLEKRIEWLEIYLENNDFDLNELTLLAFGLCRNQSFKENLINSIRTVDISFKSDAERELSLLVSICLIELMNRRKLRNNISIRVICLSMYYENLLIPELIEKSFEYYTSESIKLREEKFSLKMSSEEYLNETIEALKDKEVDEIDKDLLANALSEILTNHKINDENQNRMKKTIDILKEESNILSWITGNYSNDLEIELNKSIDPSNIALILAKELADIVNVCPGPFAYKAFLNKMLSNCDDNEKEYSLVEIIDAIDNKQKENIINQYYVNEKFEKNIPMLTCIKVAFDIGDVDIWSNSAKNKLSIDASSVKNTISQWAYSMYLECLLMKFEG